MKNFILITCLLQVSFFVFGQKLVSDTTFTQGIYVVNEKTYNDSSVVITKKINKVDISDLVLEHKSRLEASTRELYASFDYAKSVGKTLDALEAKDKALTRIADTSLLASKIVLSGENLVGTYSIVEFGTSSDLTISITDKTMEWQKGAAKGKVKVFSDNVISLDSWKKKERLALYRLPDGTWCNADGIFKMTKK
jgi:hypothetical protein